MKALTLEMPEYKMSVCYMFSVIPRPLYFRVFCLTVNTLMCKIASHATKQLDMFINVEFYAEPCRFCPMCIYSYKHVADRITFIYLIHHFL